MQGTGKRAHTTFTRKPISQHQFSKENALSSPNRNKKGGRVTMQHNNDVWQLVIQTNERRDGNRGLGFHQSITERCKVALMMIKDKCGS